MVPRQTKARSVFREKAEESKNCLLTDLQERRSDHGLPFFPPPVSFAHGAMSIPYSTALLDSNKCLVTAPKSQLAPWKRDAEPAGDGGGPGPVSLTIGKEKTRAFSSPNPNAYFRKL